MTRRSAKIRISFIIGRQKNVHALPLRSLKTAGGTKPKFSFKRTYITPLPLRLEVKWKASQRHVITAATLMLFMKQRERETKKM